MAAFEQLRAGHTSPPHQPSARWTVSPTTRISSRPLGALEARFDASSQLEGMSDTFIRLQLELPGEREDDYVWKRLGWSWAALRSSHPALAMVVRDGEQGVREFVYEASSGVEESARTAWETLVVEEIGEDEEGETTVEGVMERVQAENVINGPRVLLDQARCLARLVIISDGVSILAIVRDLFKSLTDPVLPSPTSAPPYRSLSSVLSGSTTTFDSQLSVPPEWASLIYSSTTIERLPLSSEECYPPLPPQSSPTPTPSSSTSTLARARWFWAISYVISENANLRHPHSHQVPRLPGFEGALSVQPFTRWPRIKFSRPVTARLVSFSRSNGFSPSMLLYSILSTAVASILAQSHTPSTPYLPIVIGFPFSLRPFLSPSHPTTSNDLAIRITFGSIHLPFSPPFRTLDRKTLRSKVAQAGNLASKQFRRKLEAGVRERGQFLASGFIRISDQMRSSSGESSSPRPTDQPKSAINASMVGDVDRHLPTSFSLPALDSSIRLSDLLMGTRLHRGEGILVECWTWDGEMTMALGWDSHCVDSKLVDEILGNVMEIGERLVSLPPHKL